MLLVRQLVLMLLLDLSLQLLELLVSRVVQLAPLVLLPASLVVLFVHPELQMRVLVVVVYVYLAVLLLLRVLVLNVQLELFQTKKIALVVNLVQLIHSHFK